MFCSLKNGKKKAKETLMIKTDDFFFFFGEIRNSQTLNFINLLCCNNHYSKLDS